jgi:GNAT superfamily N-acetyltransferase
MTGSLPQPSGRPGERGPRYAGNIRAVAGIEVRAAVPADLPQIAAVALATGQDEEWAGADPAYMNHLLAHGTVLAGVMDGTVIGFGATRQLGRGPGAVSMLCDLFVSPQVHGSGCGRAILARLWPGEGRRMTFSSQHRNALPLYTSFGLDAWWPLLYLRGRVDAVPAPAGWRAQAAEAAEVAALELAWTGADRIADHRAWARRPGGGGLLARRADQVLAAAAVGGAGDGYGLTHLALAPSAGGDDAAAAVLTVLARLEPRDGRALACLPAPHPAVRVLLRAGWRIEEHDLFMASDPALLDPRRTVPSPALA